LLNTITFWAFSKPSSWPGESDFSTIGVYLFKSLGVQQELQQLQCPLLHQAALAAEGSGAEMSSSVLGEVKLWANAKEREKYENLAGGWCLGMHACDQQVCDVAIVKGLSTSGLVLP
jgi:hypothetical protein